MARAGDPPLFRSLEQVSSHTLVCLLAQLADLSRCAGDIFGELEGQAAALGHRTAELHRRLDALHAATARLDHRRVKIRKWLVARGEHRGTEALGQLLPPAPWRPRLSFLISSGAHGCRRLGWGGCPGSRDSPDSGFQEIALEWARSVAFGMAHSTTLVSGKLTAATAMAKSDGVLSKSRYIDRMVLALHT